MTLTDFAAHLRHHHPEDRDTIGAFALDVVGLLKSRPEQRVPQSPSEWQACYAGWRKARRLRVEPTR